MKTNIRYKTKNLEVDLSKPIDISIPLSAGKENVTAFFIPPPQIQPFQVGNFIGSISEGGSCNVNNIFFNPHGNGTHTECLGHITKEKYTINECLKQFFFLAQLITINPVEFSNKDKVVTKEQIQNVIQHNDIDALIIRTLPNGDFKINKQYSGTNPTYLHWEAAEYIKSIGIKHLLVDFPSVDKEDDGGILIAHHSFWQYPDNPRLDATISELIYVKENVKDAFYLLNIQIASFQNDASPSKPVLYSCAIRV